MSSQNSTTDLLAGELLDLDSLWDEVRSQWDDRMAEGFAAEVIEPLRHEIRQLKDTLLEHSSPLP